MKEVQISDAVSQSWGYYPPHETNLSDSEFEQATRNQSEPEIEASGHRIVLVSDSMRMCAMRIVVRR